MIGKIKGTLSELEGNKGLVETAGGVFYEIYLTSTILAGVVIGNPVEIYTYFHVKEDSQTLFGFSDKKQHALFQLLLGVDGVGPKSAFTIISYASAEEITEAVMVSNHVFFSSISGIGKKTAHKILLELSGKLDVEFSPGSYTLSRDEKTILDALAALGFDKRGSSEVLSELNKELSIEEKIKQAIRLLTKK